MENLIDHITTKAAYFFSLETKKELISISSTCIKNGLNTNSLVAGVSLKRERYVIRFFPHLVFLNSKGTILNKDKEKIGEFHLKDILQNTCILAERPQSSFPKTTVFLKPSIVEPYNNMDYNVDMILQQNHEFNTPFVNPIFFLDHVIEVPKKYRKPKKLAYLLYKEYLRVENLCIILNKSVKDT